MKPLYTPSDTKRAFEESPKPNDSRSEFRKDYARLIHSSSFRRLVGKTQLFPGGESDFFRNRLTHSMEVAQIAKSIAANRNAQDDYFKQHPLDLDLIEFAALSHDLGHAPFGHIGEKALDSRMKDSGGFEGNAHTLRLLGVIEKKVKGVDADNFGFRENGLDERYGLNLTYRSLAAILKYDKLIPMKREKENSLAKGYYDSEKELVQRIRECVTGKVGYTDEIKTVECDIMDIADDIAYSTYDLEDALKASFITPLDFIVINGKVLSEVVKKVNEKSRLGTKTEVEIKKVLQKIMSDVLLADFDFTDGIDYTKNSDAVLEVMGRGFENSKLMDYGYYRYAFSSSLIDRFINGVSVTVNHDFPVLSTVIVDPTVKLEIEVLKYFIFYSITMSPLLKVPEFRGYEIVDETFRIVTKNPSLLANDYKEIYARANDKNRVVCDFVAGMTDRYIIEFYGRLKSEKPQTIFKPL